jgi:hypothetical protein
MEDSFQKDFAAAHGRYEACVKKDPGLARVFQ